MNLENDYRDIQIAIEDLRAHRNTEHEEYYELRLKGLMIAAFGEDTASL